MNYPNFPDFSKMTNNINYYGQLMHEYGSQNIQTLVDEAEQSIKSVLERLVKLPIDPALARLEPDDIGEIRLLRPEGPRKLWGAINELLYKEKLEGAVLSRFAGCTLGAIVEGWSILEMEDFAKLIGDAFPPENYWSKTKMPYLLRYGRNYCSDYTSDGINGVPVDDDIAYTLLGLLIAEDYGIDFTVEDVGKAWLRYLPYACTAEDIALKNLKKGIEASKAAEIDNPYCQWIGADIRSDPWAYMAPAYPEKAAELAYRDAYLSHRRNGIYGEMFFSAAQSAAFAVDNAVDALKIGLT